MAIVQSFGALQSPKDASSSWNGGGQSAQLSLYGRNQAYAEIYRTQPNVRICVDFLARNIAQLGLHAFRRVSDTDRMRLADHDVTNWLSHPNPTTRRYRLFESVVSDLGIYFNAYWLKVRYSTQDGRPALGFVRLPPEEMTVNGALLPSSFTWTRNGRERDFSLDDVVYFNGYNPSNPLMGLSPLETLRRILAEEQAAGDYRESLWAHGAKHEGVIERPVTAKKWETTQRDDFRRQWQEFASSSKAGMTAVLEDGMQYKQASFSSKDSEYTAGGKLRREVCAASYHIPLPLVGILDHATFSNVKEQHKHLYQDTLGPWLEMLAEEIEAQVLVESEDQADVYLEFNIADKLKGSFEEQAGAIQMMVGRPVMTANEGRARLNLPRMQDDPSADELAAQQGGPGSPSGTAPAADETLSPDAADSQAKVIVGGTLARITARMNKVELGARSEAFKSARWMRELAQDLTPIIGSDRAQLLAENTIEMERLRIAAEDLSV